MYVLQLQFHTYVWHLWCHKLVSSDTIDHKKYGCYDLIAVQVWIIYCFPLCRVYTYSYHRPQFNRFLCPFFPVTRNKYKAYKQWAKETWRNAFQSLTFISERIMHLSDEQMQVCVRISRGAHSSLSHMTTGRIKSILDANSIMYRLHDFAGSCRCQYCLKMRLYNIIQCLGHVC